MEEKHCLVLVSYLIPAGQQCSLLCHIFCSMMYPVFSIMEKSGMQGDQFSISWLHMTQTCIDLSALMVPFQVCQFNYRHQCTPHHQRCRFLNRVLIKSWMVHLFSLFDFDFCPQNIFSTLPRSILNELGQEKTAIFLDDSQMASSLHGRAVT